MSTDKPVKPAEPVKPFSKAKSAVVRAASQAIREDGPRAATLKNVARRASITEPAIFRHFDGVEGLFAGLYHVAEAVSLQFENSFDETLPPLHRLGRALRARIGELAADPDLAYLVAHPYEVFGSYAELRARVDVRAARERELAAACLAEARETGVFKAELSLETAEALIVGASWHLISQWAGVNGEFDLLSRFDTMWAEFLRMAAPHAAPRKKAVKS